MVKANTLVGLLIFILGLPTFVFAKDYEIRLFHPDNIGNEYQISMILTSEQTQKIFVDSVLLKKESDIKKLEFIADIKVLDIGVLKKATKLAITISKLEKIEQGTRTTLLAPKTKVIASIRNNQELFEINRKVVSGELYESLSWLSLLDTQLDKTDDDIMGTTERKSVGDKWSVNQAEIAEYFGKEGYNVAARDVFGNMTLENIVRRNNKKYLKIGGAVIIWKLIAPTDPSMTGIGSGQITYSWLYPEKAGGGPIEASASIDMSIKSKTKPQTGEPNVVVDMTLKEFLLRSYKYK